MNLFLIVWAVFGSLFGVFSSSISEIKRYFRLGRIIGLELYIIVIVLVFIASYVVLSLSERFSWSATDPYESLNQQ